MTTTATPELGQGIYSIPDAAIILNMPKEKVRRWVKKYWEYDFLSNDQSSYTWGESRDKAFDFLTLIEIIAVDSFRETGVSFANIKLAHQKLSEMLETTYPFAHAKLMTDGKTIFHEYLKGSLLEMSEKQQFAFTNLVAPYCKKIDYTENTRIAERFWPLGKDHSIVVDPHHSFGQPVISGTNITAESIYGMIKGGDSAEMVAYMYEIELSAVEDVVTFMKQRKAS
jgi:uncharacterized protein (DUF433 family)